MSIKNMDKLLSYIGPLSKNDIYIDKNLIYSKCRSIKLSESLFLIDNCEMCGKCCISEDNIFTESEYNKIKNFSKFDFENFENMNFDYKNIEYILKNTTVESHEINGENIKLYKVKNSSNYFDLLGRGNLKRCQFLFNRDDKYLCAIHPIESITCIMPHLRFIYNHKKSSCNIGIHQYGRNWALKCPVEFENSFEINSKIIKFEKLLLISKDLKIETYIPEILHILKTVNKNNYKTVCGVNIVKRNLRLM